MDLSVVAEGKDVCIKKTYLGVLLNITAEPRDNGACVPLDLTIGLGVIRGLEHIFDCQYLTQVLENLGSEPLTIVRHQDAQRPIRRDLMGYKCFCHTLGCYNCNRNGMGGLREAF